MWPAFISAAGSFLSAGMNNLFSRQNAETSFKHQKDLMALQQQYAVDNWNRENNYNRPEEQMKRLKDAGLNPDLVYGNGAAGLQAGPTASPTAPAAPMAQTIPMSNPVADAVQAAVGIAQAKKVGAETIGQKIQNDFDLKSFQDRLVAFGKQNQKTDAEISKLSEEAANLQQEFSVMTAQLNLWHLDAKEKRKRLGQMDERFEKEMRALDDAHRLSYEEYRRLRTTFDDFVRITKASADETEANAKMAGLLFKIEDEWKETEKSLGVAGTFIKILRMIIK